MTPVQRGLLAVLVLGVIYALFLGNEHESSGLAVTIVAIAGYFVPTIIAAYRHHHNLNSIAVINFFLGWTFIGWVVALAMAVAPVKPLNGSPTM